MVFELQCKKVIPKIACPQAKNSHIQTRSVEKLKCEGDMSAPLTSENGFQISVKVNIGLRRATFLILKKGPLNVHFQGSKFELCGASFNGGLLMYVYLFKQMRSENREGVV